MGNFSLDTKDKRFAAFILAAICLLVLVKMGLIVPLLSGLFAHQMVFFISKHFLPESRVDHTLKHHRAARSIAGYIIATVLVLAIGCCVMGVQYLLNDGDSIKGMMLKISEIVESARASLPQAVAEHIPEQEALFGHVGAWLKLNAGIISSAGITTLKEIGFALLGMLLGVMVAVAEATRCTRDGPATEILLFQINELRKYFTIVATAQIKISAINTACTALYLYVILPMFGVDLGMKGALITTTFLAGLLPVVGNLIANVAMTIISLDHSLIVAVMSLSYLIFIHKFEYIFIGKIVGTKINADVWEILIAMILMEHIFGVAGLVIAPIFYAWLKSEWRHWDSTPSHP